MSTKIQNLAELALHVGAARPTKESIARRLYKDTTCGIGFHPDDYGVVVSGYCEGDVGDCPTHYLKWGFTAEQFDKAVEQADKDGCDLWEQTHGCDDCSTFVVGNYRPVDPGCSTCQGSGQVL